MSIHTRLGFPLWGRWHTWVQTRAVGGDCSVLDKLCAGGEVPAATPVLSLQRLWGCPAVPLPLCSRASSHRFVCTRGSIGPSWHALLCTILMVSPRRSLSSMPFPVVVSDGLGPFLQHISPGFQECLCTSFMRYPCSACSPEPLFVDPSKGVSTFWTAADYFFPRRAIALSATRNKGVRRHRVAEW